MKLLKILLIFLIPLSLFAKEEIDGAFGIKFGQEFPDSDKIVVKFKPAVPLDDYKEFEYSLTPISKKVYKVKASYPRTEICSRYFPDILMVLDIKYKKVTDGYNSGKYTDNNDNTIKAACNGYISYLTYTSSELSVVAEEERKKLKIIELQKIDL